MASRFPNNVIWNTWERPTTTTTSSSSTSPPPFTPVVQTYAAGTYTVPLIVGATHLKLELVGAGGGGGNDYDFSPYFGGGGGGGGGGYSTFILVITAYVAPFHLTVGFGGALAGGFAGRGTDGQPTEMTDNTAALMGKVFGGLGGYPATFPGAGGNGGVGVSGNTGLGGDGGKGADGALTGGVGGLTGFLGFGTQGTGGTGGEGSTDPYAGYGVDGFARLTWT